MGEPNVQDADAAVRVRGSRGVHARQHCGWRDVGGMPTWGAPRDAQRDRAVALVGEHAPELAPDVRGPQGLSEIGCLTTAPLRCHAHYDLLIFICWTCNTNSAKPGRNCGYSSISLPARTSKERVQRRRTAASGPPTPRGAVRVRGASARGPRPRRRWRRSRSSHDAVPASGRSRAGARLTNSRTCSTASSVRMLTTTRSRRARCRT